jgi:hypothetical protein
MNSIENIKLKEMNERIEGIASQVNQLVNYHEKLDEMVIEVKDALVGNKLTNDGGIIKRVQEHEASIKELQSYKDKMKWTVSVVGVGASVLGFVIKIILDKFF